MESHFPVKWKLKQQIKPHYIRERKWTLSSRNTRQSHSLCLWCSFPFYPDKTFDSSSSTRRSHQHLNKRGRTITPLRKKWKQVHLMLIIFYNTLRVASDYFTLQGNVWQIEALHTEDIFGSRKFLQRNDFLTRNISQKTGGLSLNTLRKSLKYTADLDLTLDLWGRTRRNMRILRV